MGIHAKIPQNTREQVYVSRFTDDLVKPIMLNMVHAVIVYDYEYSGETYVMIIQNSLYMRSMKVKLLPTFMILLAVIKVDECLHFLLNKPSNRNHSICFKDDYIQLILKFDGILSYLPCWMTIQDEIYNPIVMIEFNTTCEVCNPHDTTYQDQEESVLTFRGDLKYWTKGKFIVSSVI